ncbi:MAG: hypothetical protein K2N87_10855 [Eubacterium sp.]|nr:hypothetical protein [Eubacterium sp.]
MDHQECTGKANRSSWTGMDPLEPEERERQIAQIIGRSVLKPQKLGSALRNLWGALGVRGICFGVWDCMLLALLLDGALWAAVYEAAKHSPEILGLLVFLASPVLYAMLHLLTVWKEAMAGTYEALMVCRMSLRQVTVLRLLLFGGVSAVLLGGVNLWAFFYTGQEVSALRMLCLSMAALFFYAWMQMLLEWKWRHRMAYAAAPVLWGVCTILLLLSGEKGRLVLEAVPDAGFLLCAGVCAGMYGWVLKKYYFEPCEAVG